MWNSGFGIKIKGVLLEWYFYERRTVNVVSRWILILNRDYRSGIFLSGTADKMILPYTNLKKLKLRYWINAVGQGLFLALLLGLIIRYTASGALAYYFFKGSIVTYNIGTKVVIIPLWITLIDRAINLISGSIFTLLILGFRKKFIDAKKELENV